MIGSSRHWDSHRGSCYGADGRRQRRGQKHRERQRRRNKMLCTISLSPTCYAHKPIFDDKVHPIEFKPGDLVQIYNSKLDVTYEMKAKLLPHWSPPRIITDWLLNLYM